MRAGAEVPGRGARRPEVALDILLVADDPDMRTYLRRCLAAHDRAVRVVETEHPDSVIAWINDHAPDMVIVDLDGTGGEGMELLRQALAPRAVPLLVLADEPTAAEARIPSERAAHESVVAKPFNARRLCVELERLLESRATVSRSYDRPSTDRSAALDAGQADIRPNHQEEEEA